MTVKQLLLISALIFSGISGARAQECKPSQIEALRSGEFKKLLKAKKHVQAAQALLNYLEKNECYTQLVYNPTRGATSDEIPDEARAGVRSYLWARNDVAYAFLKADKTAQCLDITDTALYEFYDNPLTRLDDAKLTAAYQYNQQACQKRREQLFPRQTGRPCENLLQGKTAKKFFKLENDQTYTLSVPVKSVKSTYQTVSASGFTCIGLVEVEVPFGMLNGLCATTEECQKSGDTEDLRPVEIPMVAGRSLATSEEILEIPIKGIEDAESVVCGDFTLSENRDVTGETVFRLEGDWMPCAGGTARGALDQVFSLKDGKASVEDELFAGFH